MRITPLVTAALVALASSATPALATEPALTWPADFGRFEPPDYALTGALAAGAIAGYFLLDPATSGPRGGVLFDDQLRSWLRIDDASARARAATVSDLGQSFMLAFPLVDAWATAGLAHRNPDAALQMTLIDAQAIALSLTVVLLTKNLIGRERPYGLDCGPDSRCGGEARHQSFISGHSAAAFTGAGLVCAHHEAMPLYGGGAADLGVCLAGLAIASTTGMLRVATDNHYTTDVLAGAAVGLASGYLMPKLLYYRTGRGLAKKDDEPMDASKELGLAAPEADDHGPKTFAVPELGSDRIGLRLLITY
ncbi:phosphatase PAP2 family protein [Myxococcota bacterium]|nr:phosphatase PAP2 family protein [Myxococcota bacterium]